MKMRIRLGWTGFKTTLRAPFSRVTSIVRARPITEENFLRLTNVPTPYSVCKVSRGFSAGQFSAATVPAAAGADARAE